MRIILSLDNAVYAAVQTYAKSRHLMLGKAAAELIRRGLCAPLKTRVVNGFHVLDLPEGSPRITSARVKRLQDA
jgi:hypothetical protein